MRLERAIPRAQARRILRLSRSNDSLTQSVTRASIAESEWQRLWLSVGGGTPDLIPTLGPDGTADGTPSMRDWRREENDAWVRLQVQGVGADLFRGDRTSNAWLRDPARAGFRERHFIAALELRSGTYPTKEFLARGRNKEGAGCRSCRAPLESVSHILGQCPGVQGSRIRRHHKVCELLSTEAERAGWKVTREFRVETPGGDIRIPDLVCQKDGSILVLDVTIRYETGRGALSGAAAEKVAKYQPLAQQISEKCGGGEVKVMGFPVGARGKWPSENNSILTALGLDSGRRESFARLISRRTMLYSLDVLRDFAAAVGRQA